MSRIIYHCPCGKVFNYSSKYSGRKALCSNCRTPYTVPTMGGETETPSVTTCDESTQTHTVKTLPELISWKDLHYEAPDPSESDAAKPASNVSSREESSLTESKESNANKDFERLRPNDLETLASLTLLPTKSIYPPSQKKIRQLGSYRIVNVLERGGMGRISLAKDEIMDRFVIVKEIRSRHAKKEMYRKRLILEARITGFLDHPGIVPVYALEEDEFGNPYYVMRRIRGISLEKKIVEYHKNGMKLVELKELLRHYIAACKVIAYAHHMGIIHRDLKPDNLMLGEYGATFILDWGLAKRVDRVQQKEFETFISEMDDVPDEKLTQINTRVGTRWYKAPEYLKTGISHPRNDIYALGVILYKILTNKLPYDNLGITNELMAIALEPPKKPHEENKKVSKPLSAICMKAIEKEMGKRYHNPLQLADDVQKWLENEPVSVYQYTFSENVMRFFSRK